jgi:hypothetical protein
MPLILSGSVDISGSMTATTIVVSSPGAAGMVSSSAQITELVPLMQATASLNSSTSSLIAITNGLMAVTASMKAASIVSSSQQIQNYNTFALASSLGSYVPLTGAELSGPITVVATSNTTNASIRVVGAGVSTILLGQNSRGGVIRGQGGNDELSIFTGGDGNHEPSAGTERMRVSGNGSIGAGGSTTNIYNASDIRLKKNITPITLGLNAVSALNPVKFNWADGFDLVETDKTLLGFVAQEVQEVIPEAVESFSGETKLNDTIITDALRVNEKFLIPVLTKAIQEQQAIIDGLIARIEALENN